MSENSTNKDGKATELIKENISSVKERIIHSGRLLSVLTRSKKDLDTTKEENVFLAAKVQELERELTAKNEAINNLTTEKSLIEKKALNNYNEKVSAEQAFNSNKMYIQQLEAECETLKQAKEESNNSKTRQEMSKKMQEIKMLKEQVKELRIEMHSLNKKLEEAESENEKLDMDNLALKMDIEEMANTNDMKEKIANINELKGEVESLKSKITDINVEKLELQEKLEKSKSDLSNCERTIENLQRAQNRRRSSTKSIIKPITTENVTAPNPLILQKFRKLKINYDLMKSENKNLKRKLQDAILNATQNQSIDELLRSSSSEDDYDGMDYSMGDSFSDNDIADPTPLKNLTELVPSPTISPTTKLMPRPMSFSGMSNTPTTSSSRPALYTTRSASTSSNIYSSTNTPTHSIESASKPISRTTSASSNKPISMKTLVSSSKGKLPISIDTSINSSKKKSSVSASPTIEVFDRNVNQPSKFQSESSKAAYRVTGLTAPPPKITASASSSIGATTKTKKTKSKLMKFVNSRNPSKVIDSKPLITSSKKRALSPESVRSTQPTSLTPEKPASPTSITPITETPVTETPTTSHKDEPPSKKSKMETFLADQVKQWVAAKKFVQIDEIDESDIDKYLSEIKWNYAHMKSPSDPDSKGLITYGITGQFTIEIPNKSDPREKAYAWILSYLSNRKPKYFTHIYQALCNELKVSLKSKRPDISCARYARLLCMICKSLKCLEQIRVICYDIVRHSTCTKNSIICLYNIACGWQEALTITDSSGLLLNSLQVCCNAISADTKTPANIKTMYTKMSTRCSWSSPTETISLDQSVEKIFQEFLSLEHEEDKEVINMKRFQILKSFEIVFHIMGSWKKLYNQFILERMWPLLSNEKLNEIALEIMATLGTFGLSDDHTKNDKPGVQQIFDLMNQVYTIDDEVLNSIQVTALKGAHLLAVNDSIRMAKIKGFARKVI